MVRIMTDSAADFSLEEATRLQIELLPLNIQFDDRSYQQELDPGFHEFFELLKTHDKIPSTSQAAPEHYLERFGAARAAGDELVAITLSSGLSSTYASGLLAREMLGCDGIYVVDGQTAVMGQRILVDQALKLRAQGKSGSEIRRELEALRPRVRIYGMLDTLEYLRKGGRIPKSAALLGTLLSVKPVIIVKDGVIGMAGKARGSSAGLKMMFERIDQGPEIDRDYPVYFGYTHTAEYCEKFRAGACAKYALVEPRMVPIGGVVGTHIGPGATAIAYVESA